MKRILTILGALLILFGLFFALQGANIIHWPLESTMLGRGVWIRNGILMAAMGAVLLAGVRKRRR
jgi:Mg2+ and Co2+ transporter CorA